MSINIGENTFIFKEDIIAVFDRDTILKSKGNNAFIQNIKEDLSVNKTNKEIKSYILTQNGDNPKVYASNISSNSIKINLNRRD